MTPAAKRKSTARKPAAKKTTVKRKPAARKPAAKRESAVPVPVGLLKDVKEALGDGGLCSGASCGWGSCEHCHGWPDHEKGCVVSRVDAFLKNEGRAG